MHSTRYEGPRARGDRRPREIPSLKTWSAERDSSSPVVAATGATSAWLP